MIYETAPAKINLTLDTLFKRDDGYHEIAMIMTTVDLNDRLSFQKEKIKIVVDIEHNYVPNDHKNLAYRAAQLMMETYDLNEGVTITIDKDIPVSAGLAGGSADAAATMRGINRLFNLDKSLHELSDLGIQIGTDIPFCIYNRTAVCKVEVKRYAFKEPPSAWVVLAKPNLGISSADVFKALDLDDAHHVDTEMCEKAIVEGDYKQLCESLSNRLEPVSMSMHPEIKNKKQYVAMWCRWRINEW